MFKMMQNLLIKTSSFEVTRKSPENFIAEKEKKANTHIEKSEAPNSNFECSVCGYQAKSISGLRMRMNRKHTKYDEKLTSFQC